MSNEVRVGSMFSEVVDAIDEYFKDDETIAVDCMLWLREKVGDNSGVIARWLEDKHRCVDCGEKMVRYDVREYHPEVDCYENLSFVKCPSCD